MTNWIKCGDRMPEENIRVLTYAEGRIEIAQRDEMGWYSSELWFDFDEVTHWMPLPEPPEVEK